MATSAPSLAKAMATARPMPLSPPVISATLPRSLPLPRCCGSSDTRPRRHLRLDARLPLLMLGRLLLLLFLLVLLGHGSLLIR